MNNKNKLRFISLGAGTAMTLVVGVLLLTVSLDMRWMAAEAIVLASILSYLVSKQREYGEQLLHSFIITVPFAIFFWQVISGDLPSLWFLIVFVFGASFLAGLLRSRAKGLLKMIGSATVLTVLSVLLIPKFVSDDLTQYVKQETVPFELIDHKGRSISSEELTGKVVVLDFYGTWCRPCIAELPELAKVRNHFEGNEDVVFLVVNSDQRGDNLEKAIRFEQRFGNGFRFAYDHGRKTHKSLGLTSSGVPSLLIIDAEGFVRMKHIGFNQSETDFVKKTIKAIETILRQSDT